MIAPLGCCVYFECVEFILFVLMMEVGLSTMSLKVDEE